MTTPPRRIDRRMQHTRQMLQQAFMEVAQEKGLVATTVQDITRRADVNRGTFYLHFADKYMLIDSIIREQFQQHLASPLPPASCWNRKSLLLLIQALLEYCEVNYRHQPHLSHVFVPQFEQAIYEELTKYLLIWIKQEKRNGARGHVPPETIARVAGWAIFGTAVQWSREETTISSEQMARDILLVVVEGMAGLAPVLS